MTMFRALAAIAIVASPAPAFAARSIASTFDNSDEGWLLGTYHTGVSKPVDYNVERKYIEGYNGWGGGGFIAPEVYIGNKTGFIGGEFSFQLSIDYPPEPDTRRAVMALVGANGETIFSNWLHAPGAEPTEFIVNLTADSFYRGELDQRRAGVTDAEFAAIMADLSMVFINVDWNAGNFVRLDNVLMFSNNAVPEPASWALMIGGFGLAGASLRRRHVQVRFA